jgi:hypothetical protein
MKSTERGVSIEWLLGMALTLVVLLVDPEKPGWRILILVAIAVLFVDAVRKSQWMKRGSPILTLTGEFFPDDGESFSRKLSGYALVLLGIAIFGFVTWPTRYSVAPGDCYSVWTDHVAD